MKISNFRNSADFGWSEGKNTDPINYLHVYAYIIQDVCHVFNCVVLEKTTRTSTFAVKKKVRTKRS